jgi:glycerol-1-phosphate dehydrogenase [NAD(P)+]
MRSDLERALNSARDTRVLEIDLDIIHEIPAFFRKQFPQKKAIVVCDLTTWEVAGKKVFQDLQANGLTGTDPFIFPEKRPYAEFDNVLMLDDILKMTDAIPVAVGSGTINDLTKLSSFRNNRPYLCVATAASMDGYTAFGASISFKGSKQTFSCPAPQAVFADIAIIRKAPAQMTASGYADLFAKVTAGADWILADALDVEPIDQCAWSIVQDGLKSALADPKGANEGKMEAITPLVDGLILGGFAMQWSQSSRPASGAEHQFSHLWNMEHHTYQGEMPSHGFQVGVATLAVTMLYEKLLQTPMDQLDISTACRNWPDWEKQEATIREMFGQTDFLETAMNQSRAKYISRDELAIQLKKLKNNWQAIRNRLSAQLVPSDEVRRRLMQVGAPVEPQEIGISTDRIKTSFMRAQYIRSRFTILDLAVRTGYLEEWLNQMY